MPGKNKTPLLGWHPPAELSAWVRAEAERRGVSISSVLNEAVENERLRSEDPLPDHQQGESSNKDEAVKHRGNPA